MGKKSKTVVKKENKTSKNPIAYFCSPCSKKFQTKTSFIKHNTILHSQFLVNYKCPLCEITFLHKKNFPGHYRIHGKTHKEGLSLIKNLEFEKTINNGYVIPDGTVSESGTQEPTMNSDTENQEVGSSEKQAKIVENQTGHVFQELEGSSIRDDLMEVNFSSFSEFITNDVLQNSSGRSETEKISETDSNEKQETDTLQTMVTEDEQRLPTVFMASMLEEICWRSAELDQHRRWKKTAAKFCSFLVKKHFDEKELKMKSIAKYMAKEMSIFWMEVQFFDEIEGKERKKGFFQRLHSISIETEKYSSKLEDVRTLCLK